MSNPHPLYPSQHSYDLIMSMYDEALTRWNVPIESVMLDTALGQTHVLIAGDRAKPPLILYHGWNGNASGNNGDFDMKRLTQKFCVYNPDIPGHPGRSAQVRPDTAGNAYGLWAREVIDALGIDTFYVTGPSGGGYMALKTAAHLGERTRRLLGVVPFGIPPSRYPPAGFFLIVIRAMMQGRKRGTEALVKQFFGPNPPEPDFAHYMQVMTSNFKTWFNPAPLSDDELRAVQCPVELIFGSQDITMNVPAAVKRARHLLPNANIEILDNEGHIFSKKGKKRINDTLMSWL